MRGSIPRWEQRKFILTKNFIKMKNSSTETFKHGIAKPVLKVVVIGKKSFKNADEFKDYCDDAMHDFLDNIQELNGYTYPADGDSLFEYEEGITFYYTKKGSELVHRWIKRMEAIFDKYFPDDYGFQPKCCYWKVL